jgi:RNA polymerase sigma-70 factor (ECF subfamily)
MADEVESLREHLLVVRAQAGDEAAFEGLVRRYAPRLRYFLRKRHGDRAGGDDILQEVRLEAYRCLPRLADPRAFAPWLYRIARNRAVGSRRKRRAEPAVFDEDQFPAGAEDAGGFDAEDAARVHAALDALSPEHREVLVLRFLEEMSYEQIGGVVGLPPGTVASRIHYAKIALRGILKGMSHE